MTLVQKIQLWMVIGTWVGGLATLLAVMTLPPAPGYRRHATPARALH